ncbi:hypothetical protein D3C84_723440 [compost metagenome]
MATLDELVGHQIARIAVRRRQRLASGVCHHGDTDLVVAIHIGDVVKLADDDPHVQGGATAVDHQRLGELVAARADQAGECSRQALRHDFHADDVEQLPLVEADGPHQVAPLLLYLLFVALAIVRVVELGDGQGDSDGHVAGGHAGLQQGVVHGKQVEIVVLVLHMGGRQGLVRGGVIGVLGVAYFVVVDLLVLAQGGALPILAKGVGGDDGLEHLVLDPAHLDVGGAIIDGHFHYFRHEEIPVK